MYTARDSGRARRERCFFRGPAAPTVFRLEGRHATVRVAHDSRLSAGSRLTRSRDRSTLGPRARRSVHMTPGVDDSREPANLAGPPGPRPARHVAEIVDHAVSSMPIEASSLTVSGPAAGRWGGAVMPSPHPRWPVVARSTAIARILLPVISSPRRQPWWGSASVE